MESEKFFDHKNNCPIDLDTDGCSLSEWEQLYGKKFYARHPKGFKIYLSPEKIISCDEYANLDPYTVEQNLDSEFHKRRISLTIDLIHEVVSEIQGCPQILDLGCGQGHITKKIHEAVPSAELTGLDYSISSIEYAHEHFSGIDFAVGDAYACPYTNEFFDVVVCNNLWEHVPDPLFLLSRIKRILKPEGYVIISTPSRYRLDNLLRILKGKPVSFMSHHHVTEYTVGQVVEQFAYGGFQVKKIVSRPISTGNMITAVMQQIFTVMISLVGSHHQLESTVFYLAKKNPDIPVQSK